ncbi:ribosome silencing factor [Constrictibacter sp. MBR-5]|uniref:ribosome silencing factor n=1 Tax=Constrictibacter sp. MBR-5 TaxID=3156467 RepID=UPI003399D100
MLDLTLQRLDDDQAQDVVVIDLRGKSSICDQMVVASGRAQRHVAAMAEHLAEDLKPLIGRAPAIEGLPAGDWVLIDAGDVIVHLFRPEVRAFYNLEKMWGVELAEAAPSRSNAS